jgi:hypothetical protein
MIVSEKVVSPTGWDNSSQFGKWLSYMIARSLLVSSLSCGFHECEGLPAVKFFEAFVNMFVWLIAWSTSIPMDQSEAGTNGFILEIVT